MADMLDDDDKIRENVLTSYKTSDIVTLTLFKKCSRWSLVSFLFKLMAKNENTFQRDFLQNMKVTGLKIKADVDLTDTKNLYIQVDGEVVTLDKPEFEIRLFSDVVTVFSR